MNRTRHHPLSPLRTALFALLVLGVMLRPMAMELCEAFTKDHLAPAHAHVHHHDDGDHAGDVPAVDDSEDWHVHGKQVQADTGGAADLVVAFVFDPIRYGAAPVPTLQVASVPAVHDLGPFRPPIG